MIKIFPHQSSKHSLREYTQPSVSSRKMQTNLKIDEIGFALAVTYDITPLIQIRIKYPAFMNFLYYRGQLIEKIRNKTFYFFRKFGTPHHHLILLKNVPFDFMKGLPLNIYMKIPTLPIPRTKRGNPRDICYHSIEGIFSSGDPASYRPKYPAE